MNNKWRNRGMWFLVVGVSLSVLKQIANLLGYPIPDPSLESATNILTTIINALAILGILSDPPQSLPESQKDMNQDQSL
jgi:phi LC3 family holin